MSLVLAFGCGLLAPDDVEVELPLINEIILAKAKSRRSNIFFLQTALDTPVAGVQVHSCAWFAGSKISYHFVNGGTDVSRAIVEICPKLGGNLLKCAQSARSRVIDFGVWLSSLAH